MDERTDAELVTEALAGQRDAFALLIRKYQDYAYGTAIAMVSDFDLARDVVQEAFLHAYRDLRKCREPERFGGWLHGIVKNVARRALRELGRVGALSGAPGYAPEPLDPAPTPDISALDAEDRAMVHQALARLSQKNREAVSLYYVDGLSYSDIAGYLGVSEATVQGRLQRGRAQLRKEMIMVARTFKEEPLPSDFTAQVKQLLDAADRSVREREDSIRRLAEIGVPAVEALCEALGDPRVPVRQAAARALCAIGDARALGPILQVLASRDWQTAGVILRNKRVLNIPGVEAELIRLSREGAAEVRYWAPWVLSHSRSEEAFRCMLELFRGGPAVPVGVRYNAAAVLCAMRPGSARDFIIEALSDPQIRRTGGLFWWIALRDGHRLPIDLCRLGFGRRTKPGSRLTAGRLVLLHGEEGVKALEEIMRTGTRYERAAAAMVLARREHPEAFEILLNDLLGGSAKQSRRAVGGMLAAQYGKELIAWADAQGPDRPKSQAVDYALAQARLAADQGAGDDILWGAQPSIRAAALKTLTVLKGAEFLPELRRCLREGRPHNVARVAFDRMRRLKDVAMPTVLEMFESEHWTERKAAACLLRQWGKLTEQQRERALKDPHVAVRHAVEWHPGYKAAAKWHLKWRKRISKSD